MSVHFNAANNAQLAAPASPPAVGSFTVAGRFNLDTVTAGHIGLVWASGTGSALVQLFLDIGVPATPNWAAVMANDTNTQFSEAQGTTTITASTWNHVCATFDGTTQRLYVNGIQEGTSTPSAVTPRAGNWAAFQFPPNMAGSLQDGFACSVALTAAQVLNLSTYRFPQDRNGIQYWVPNYTLPGTANFSGVQAALTVSGGTQTVGPDPAVPWGPGKLPQAFRLSVPNGAITATDVETAGTGAVALALGAELETAGASAVAGALGKDVETGSMLGAALAAGNDVETAGMTTVAVLLGADVQTATMLAVALAKAADVETAAMTAGAVSAITGADVQTAGMTAVASAASSDVETASMTAGAIGAIAANDVQTAKMVAVAFMLGADVETATMSAAGGGGSGLRQRSYNARRPLTILMRRGTRH